MSSESKKSSRSKVGTASKRSNTSLVRARAKSSGSKEKSQRKVSPAEQSKVKSEEKKRFTAPFTIEDHKIIADVCNKELAPAVQKAAEKLKERGIIFPTDSACSILSGYLRKFAPPFQCEESNF